MWAGYLSRYSDWLRAGRSGDRIPVGARFSAPAQTGPGTHPASRTMGTGSFPGVKSGRGVTLTPHPLLVLWSPYGPYGLYRVSLPVQEVYFTCTFIHEIFFSFLADTYLFHDALFN